MTSKFNPKKFQGKLRIYLPVSGHQSIRKFLIWNEKKKEYLPPKSGKQFLARRYEPNANGGETRQSKYFERLHEAKAWQMFRKESESVNELTRKRENSYSFFDLYKDFKKHKLPLLSYGSNVNYEKALKHYEFFFYVDVEDFSPQLIDQWFDHLKEPAKMEKYKASRRSFEREVDLLKALLNWYIERTPTSKLVSPFKKYHQEMMRIKPKKSSKPRFMTPDQRDLWFETLIKVSPEFWAPAVIQTEQLFRVSEVFAMKWENLDLKNCIYRVSEHVIYPRRKGEKPFLDQSASKTEREGGYFISHLRASTVEILKELQKEAVSDLIFHNNGKLFTYRQIQSAYDKAFKAANLPFSSTHICRHTGSTCFLDETGDPLALQQMGNWATQKQAMHYGQIMKDRSKSAIEKADKLRLRLINGGKSNVG